MMSVIMNRLRGVQFLVDERGRKKAVLIDLEKNPQLWEDLHDRAVAAARAREPRETIEAVRRRLRASSKLKDDA